MQHWNCRDELACDPDTELWYEFDFRETFFEESHEIDAIFINLGSE